MTRRLASFLLLVLMASSGAYAAPAPRLSNHVRIEYSFLRSEQAKAEVPASRTAALEYPSERASWFSTDSPRVRAGIAQALFQRPPPAAY
jgi:hypothetical protein